MANKIQFERLKDTLLNNPKICKENKELFRNFFDYEIRKLKNKNELDKLDSGCYQTLIGHILRFKNVEKWFNHKAWVNLTKKDITKVYNNLNDGKIKTRAGKRFEDRSSYYNKLFKSKPFEMAGKADIAREVIEFSANKKKKVRFFNEEIFMTMVKIAIKPTHKLLMWFCWDVGENINSALKLRKKDWTRQLNKDTQEPEYLINLQAEILKRTREERGEITNFKDTVELADIVLNNLKDDEKDDELVFPFGYSQAKKILTRVVKITGAKCIPRGETITWKDFRSSMACYLLDHDWTTDEINARLGHLPSSRELDKYVAFKSMGRHKPKKKLFDSNLAQIKEELEKSKQREKLTNMRLEGLQHDVDELKKATQVMVELYKRKK